ncbi:MAG: carboxypeptidase regulatory-like domain-containing protein [Sedimentisphaerales bacterium]|nr:carboxypeptidase regulatory-like domain-containing protein [Sedimentisphaerales bacterium]
MRKNYITIISISFICSFIHSVIAIPSEQIRCTGKVTDTEGKPIAGAKVAAYEMQFDGIAGNFMLKKAGEKITSDNGSFTFEANPKPPRSTFYDCKIVAVKPGMAIGWAVWSMKENTEVNIELGRPEILEGIIVDDADKPVAGAQVRANLSRKIKTADGQEQGQWLPGISPLEELGRETDSRGIFSFDNIPADLPVDLLVTAPGKAITYTYKSETSEQAFKAGQTDIKVVLPAEARIEGKITDPDTGEEIAGTKFAVVGSSLFYYRYVHTTNDDGTFSVGGLQTGQYLLRNGGFPSTHVDVESGKTTKISVQADRLSRPRGISGIVRDQQGNPLPNATILTCPYIAEDTVTDTKGAFTLKSSSARRTRTPNDEPAYLLIRSEERNLAASEVFVESAKKFDIKLEQGAILSGKVVDVNGNVIPNAEISLTFRTSSVGFVINDNVEIDESGNYEIKAVPPGRTYYISASADGYSERQTPINVGSPANERIEIDPFVLSPANLTVSGVVVDEKNQPVPDVRIFSFGDNQPSQNTQTDAEGKFEVKACEGMIRIYANSQKLSGRIETEGRACDIKIVITENSTIRYIPKQPPSLVGKSLPELKNLNIGQLPDTTDKIILVCFFDMQQRPSRNCIIQLNKRIQELEEKGITVAAVQASKIEKEKLNDWIEENDISFRIGMIKDDEEKTRNNCGVQSLPWLILTDNEHIVKEEGFSIDALDEKIQN